MKDVEVREIATQAEAIELYGQSFCDEHMSEIMALLPPEQGETKPITLKPRVLSSRVSVYKVSLGTWSV